MLGARVPAAAPEFRLLSVSGRPYRVPILPASAAHTCSSAVTPASAQCLASDPRGSGRRGQGGGGDGDNDEPERHRRREGDAGGGAGGKPERHRRRDGDAGGGVGDVGEEAPLRTDAMLSSTLRVPASLAGAVIGKGGEVKRTLERETGGRLTVPRATAGADEVLVTMEAEGASALESLETRVALAVEDARARARPTHFVSVPLTAAAVRGRVERFVQEAVEVDPSVKGMLVPPAQLHITLATLKLFTAAQVEAARTALNSASPALRAALSDAPPLTLRGLELMNDDPTSVHVLYARIGANAAHEALQRVWHTLRTALADAQVLVEEEQKTDLAGQLKPHATVLNTRWRAGGHGGGRSVGVDVRRLLASHAHFDFGTQEMSELQLSRLGGGKAASGYYVSDATVRLKDTLM